MERNNNQHANITMLTLSVWDPTKKHLQNIFFLKLDQEQKTNRRDKKNLAVNHNYT